MNVYQRVVICLLKPGRLGGVTTKRTAAQIVEAVADAAHSLFVQRSPSDVSMREIAQTAGVNLGLIHRYVGSKDELIALVLSRHTERARTMLNDANDSDLIERVAEVVVNSPATGRLVAGMILDGVEVVSLKGDFPLLERFAKNGDATNAALIYALALGWEVFGPSLLVALDEDPDPVGLAAAIGSAMSAITAHD
jgi:AcrR family transcriptional regulator